MISLKARNQVFLSSVYSKATSLFAKGIATFASYEVTFSSYPQKLSDDVTGRKVRKLCIISYTIVNNDYLHSALRWCNLEHLDFIWSHVWLLCLGGRHKITKKLYKLF